MKYPFGEKLRAVRERRGWTMKEVAERAGLSESLISQIERNRVSPAIDTLLGLVDILDLDLEYLFADFRKERAVQIVRAGARRTVSAAGCSYEQLAAADFQDGAHGIEAFQLTIQPGCERGNSEYGHPGREMGVISQGSCELLIGAGAHRLEAGDSVSFEADAPHILRNVGTVPVVAFWVVTPPRGELGRA